MNSEQPTLICGNQFAEHGDGSHQDEAGQPNNGDGLVRMAQGLPSPGPKWVTNSVISLHRNRDQSPRGHSHRCSWK